MSLSVHLVCGMRQLEGERGRHGVKGIQGCGLGHVVQAARAGNWVSLVVEPCALWVYSPLPDRLARAGAMATQETPRTVMTHPRNENRAGLAADKLALIRDVGAGTLATLFGGAAVGGRRRVGGDGGGGAGLMLFSGWSVG